MIGGLTSTIISLKPPGSNEATVSEGRLNQEERLPSIDRLSVSTVLPLFSNLTINWPVVPAVTSPAVVLSSTSTSAISGTYTTTVSYTHLRAHET